MTLYWFNPHNDLALAVARQGRFTPPKQAALISQAGALLPLWWAAEGDYVLADKGDLDWINNVKELFGLHGEIYSGEDIDTCAPWGWSLDAVLRMRDAGAPVRALPSEQWLTRHRTLSHRRTSALMLEHLCTLLPYALPPTPIEVDSPDRLGDAISQMGGDAMVKLPYSTSGRGVFDTTDQASLTALAHGASGMIRRQGSLMVERRLDRVADFAMLYDIAADGVARLSGYSLFDTKGGAYTGNILMPDHCIRHHLSQWVPTDHLTATETAVGQTLTSIVGTGHRGALGVDMLIYRTAEGDCLIHPCVEVNLRMTMGVVAHRLTRIFYRDHALRMTISPAGNSVYPQKSAQLLVPQNPHFSFAVDEDFDFTSQR